MASEEERTETTSEAPREDTHEDHDDRESEHIYRHHQPSL